MAELEVAVGGRRLEAAEWPGADPALVLLHEGLGSVGLWRDFPSALNTATGRRVVAFSRFGHGRSDRPPQPRTPAFFHEEALEVLPAVLEQAGAAEPVLIGHSDGGSIALIHAGHHPVAGIALMAPHVIVEDVTVAAIREARAAFDSGVLRERMARHHDDAAAAFNGWCDVWLDPAFRSWSLEEDAARVDCRTLLIQGEDDPYGTLDQLDRIQARVRGPVERLVVPGGHSPHLDAPDQVLAALARWLSVGAVLTAAERRAAALAAADAETLRALLHPRFRWTSHRGETFGREEYVTRNTTRVRWRGQTLEDAEVVAEGDVAILSAVAVDEVDSRVFRMPVTQTWVRQEGAWRLLAGHAGPLLADP